MWNETNKNKSRTGKNYKPWYVIRRILDYLLFVSIVRKILKKNFGKFPMKFEHFRQRDEASNFLSR